MRPRFALVLLSVLLFAATGCDLMSDPEGPQPEDFEVEDTSSVRSTADRDDDGAVGDVRMRRQDVAAALSTARGGMTLSIDVPR